MKRYGVLEIVLGALLAALVLTVFVQVILRYVTYQPLAWTEEVARLLFIWTCMLGASVGAQRGTHFTVTVFSDLIPSRLQRVFQFVLRLVEASFYAVLAWSGVVVTRVAHLQHSTALEFPMSLSYSVIAFAGVLMCLFTLRRAYLEFVRRGAQA